MFGTRLTLAIATSSNNGTLIGLLAWWTFLGFAAAMTTQHTSTLLAEFILKGGTNGIPVKNAMKTIYISLSFFHLRYIVLHTGTQIAGHTLVAIPEQIILALAISISGGGIDNAFTHQTFARFGFLNFHNILTDNG